MRLARRALLSLALAVPGLCGGVLSAASPAAASCAYDSLSRQLAAADAVFVGRVTRVEEDSQIDGVAFWNATPVHVFTFSVSKVFAGEVAATQRVLSADSSVGLSLQSGRRYLVMARDSAADVQLAAAELASDECSGTTRASSDVLSRVTEELGPPREPRPGEAPLPSSDFSWRTAALAGAAAAVAVLAGVSLVAFRSRRAQDW